MEPLSKVVDLTVTAQAATSTVSFDENTGVLTLEAGTVNAADVKLYRSNTAVTKVVAQAGAVLPEDCSSLFYNFQAQEIDISNADSSKVKNMKSMFCVCDELTALNVSGFNTSNVTDMSFLFSGCSKLTSLDISSFNTEEVTIMQNMFFSCASLTSIDVSRFNTEKVTCM